MKNYKNKMVEGENSPMGIELKMENWAEYHFAGGGEYEPMNVKARSIQEAEEIYLKERKKIINK